MRTLSAQEEQRIVAVHAQTMTVSDGALFESLRGVCATDGHDWVIASNRAEFLCLRCLTREPMTASPSDVWEPAP